MKITLFFLLGYFCTLQAFSCSCENVKEINDSVYIDYPLIVKGTIMKVEMVAEIQQEFSIKVRLLFNGESTDSILKLQSPVSGGACGLDVKEGEDWLIFAYNYKGHLETDLCTRSQNLSKNNRSIVYDIKVLDGDIKFLEDNSGFWKRYFRKRKNK